MIIYHGSQRIVEHPIYQGSDKENDYGAAFYCTLDKESASLWAARNNYLGYINKYQFNDKNLKVLDLRDKHHYSILNWVAILMHFRHKHKDFINIYEKRLKWLEDNYYINVDEYDVVIGYRADDAYFRFPLEFIRGNLVLEDLERAYLLGDLSYQYVLTSQKAFDRLKFKGATQVDKKYLNVYFQNVVNATDQFKQLLKNSIDNGGVTIAQLMENKK